MKSTLFFSLVCLSLFCSAQGTWTELNGIICPQPASELPHERQGATGFAINNIGYVLTGFGDYDTAITYFDDMHSYDPSMNRWSPKASLPGPARRFAYACELNGKGYLTLGVDNTGGLPDTWEYNPVSDAWTQKANFAGMNRQAAFSFSIAGKFYIGGGSASSLPMFLGDLWEYDPTNNSWTPKSSLPQGPRMYAVAFVIDSTGYVVGGRNSSGSNTNTTFIYNAATDSWTSGAPTNGLYGQYAFSISGLGYIIDAPYMYRYNPVSNSWSSSASLNQLVSSAVPFGFNGEEYLLCGDRSVIKYNPGLNNWSVVYKSPASHSDIYGKSVSMGDTMYFTSWKYAPLTDTWIEDFNLNASWLFAIDSLGYSTGGSNNFKKYNPSTGWLACDTFPFSQVDFSFSIDGNGFAGGLVTDSLFQTSHQFWEYDPLIDEWNRKSDFPGRNRGYGTSFSILHKGYVSGGEDTAFSVVDDFWEYDPASDTWLQKASVPGARIGGIGTSYHGKGIVGFGLTNSVGMDYCDLFEYDPSTDVWTYVNHPLGCRSGGVIGFVADDKLFIGQGENRYSMSHRDSYYDLWYYEDFAAGISSTNVSGPLHVFPNPASDRITIDLGNDFFNQGKYILKIDNVLGSTIYSSPITQQTVHVNLKTEAGNGVYIVHLMDTGGQVIDVRKVILQ